MITVKKIVILLPFLFLSMPVYCWGFFAHRQINYYAVFLLPPQMIVLYKPYIDFLSAHATDPDKRRYVLKAEGARHYIDMDQYGSYPYAALPRSWTDAVKKFSGDSIAAHGILPWWLQTMLYRLTQAFKEKNQARILKYSAEIGHYMADAHVPLHTSKNHNGQLTGQTGIHGFWESRIPELFAANWDFFIGKAVYISNPSHFIWARILESAAAADSVLTIEKTLSRQFPPDQRFSYEPRNGKTIRQYAASYAQRYDELLQGMVERRMRLAIFSVASLWYTAWVNAGQPDLTHLSGKEFSPNELKEFEQLNTAWIANNGNDEERH